MCVFILAKQCNQTPTLWVKAYCIRIVSRIRIHTSGSVLVYLLPCRSRLESDMWLVNYQVTGWMRFVWLNIYLKLLIIVSQSGFQHPIIFSRPVVTYISLYSLYCLSLIFYSRVSIMPTWILSLEVWLS